MPIRACILGCAGLRLAPDERAFFEKTQPLGLILFKRNVENAAQVIELIRSFRAAVGRADAPVLIDQEGGRVQRLGPPNWPSFPPAAHFGEIYARDPAKGIAAARLGGRLIAAELSALGINVDCLPVADLRLAEGHGVIGDRAYGPDPETVSRLGRAAADGTARGRRAAGGQTHAGTWTRPRRQPPRLAGGRDAAHGARAHRFRGVPALERPAHRHDRPRGLCRHRRQAAGDRLAHT